MEPAISCYRCDLLTATDPYRPQKLRRGIRHIFFREDRDAHFFHLTDPPWRVPPPLGASATTPQATTPPGIIHQDIQHPQRTGVQDRPGHSGGTGWRLQHHGPSGYQGRRLSLLPQQVGLQRGVLAGYHDGCQRRKGGSGYGRPRTA